MNFEVTFAQQGKCVTVKEVSKEIKKSKVSKVFDSYVISLRAYTRLQALAVAEILFRDEIVKDELQDDAARIKGKSNVEK